MEELEKKIANSIKQLEEMIKNKESKEKIEEQREILDKLLKKYLDKSK